MRILPLLLLVLLISCVLSEASLVKEPNVAGQFYTADPEQLSLQLESILKAVVSDQDFTTVEAFIAPHAGYMYSGAVAAHAYQAAVKGRYRTVVVLAPSHFVAFDGIAVWSEGRFKTPLGTLEVDTAFARQLLSQDMPYGPLSAFEREHALEVQLPFIQKTFGEVKIVPVLMGNPNPEHCRMLARRLDQIIGNRKDVLVIASSDFSHYLSYDQANKMDALALKMIKEGDLKGLWDAAMARKVEMCGFVPVMTVLMYAKERGLQTRVLKYANSGDAAGDKNRVVGYASVVFYQQESILSEGQKKSLLNLARRTLTEFVREGKVSDEQTTDPRLSQIQGAFVTLHKDGQLRGCIGHIIPQKPLWQTVREMTIAAASEDPRFAKVGPEELEQIKLDISVLSIPRAVKDASEIMLGRDGVIISDGYMKQGVFLPQVAHETGWSKDEFLSELCRQKAGLKADCWKDPKIRLMTFQANVIAE